MVSQYKPDPEFSIDLIKDSICTSHSPFTGKVFYVNENNKSSDNPYGINFSTDSSTDNLNINTKKGYDHFQNTLLSTDQTKGYEILNSLYLKNDFRELIYSLFHIKKNVRHCAFSLLCSKVIIDQTTAPFFKVFFRNSNPVSTVLIPQGYQNNYIKFLEREFVRWLTAVEKATGHEDLWKHFSESDLAIANIIETIQTTDEVDDDDQDDIDLFLSPEVSSIQSWLSTIPEENSTIMSDQSAMKAEKIYRLRAKWLHSPSKLKTAHKFIARLFEKWDIQSESAFTKSFKMFFSGLTRAAKQIFFIFGAASNNEKVQSLSFSYITSTMPINTEDFFSSKRNAQNYVKAIYQSQLYIRTESHNSNTRGINDHFDNLMTQLMEVEDIFIPSIERQDTAWATTTIIPANKSKKITKTSYPNKVGSFNKYHFEIKTPKITFLEYAEEEGCSAHEINAISGLAIEHTNSKSSIATKPHELTPFELEYRMSFMASSRFDRRSHKKAQKKVKAKKKKEQTLEDIFNDNSD